MAAQNLDTLEVSGMNESLRTDLLIVASPIFSLIFTPLLPLFINFIPYYFTTFSQILKKYSTIQAQHTYINMVLFFFFCST